MCCCSNSLFGDACFSMPVRCAVASICGSPCSLVHRVVQSKGFSPLAAVGRCTTAQSSLGTLCVCQRVSMHGLSVFCSVGASQSIVRVFWGEGQTPCSWDGFTVSECQCVFLWCVRVGKEVTVHMLRPHKCIKTAAGVHRYKTKGPKPGTSVRCWSASVQVLCHVS